MTHGDAKSPSCLSYKSFSQPWCRGLSAPSGPAIHPLLQVLYRHRWQTAVCEASTFPFAAETLRWDSFFTKSIKDANPNKNICFTFPITNTFLQTRKSAVKSVSKFHLFFRFQSEAQLAKFGINQSGIYKSPITRFNPTPKSTIFRYNHQSTNTRYKHQSSITRCIQSIMTKIIIWWITTSLHSILIFDIKVVFPPGQWTPCLESERFWQKWHCVLLKNESLLLIIAHYTWYWP